MQNTYQSTLQVETKPKDHFEDAKALIEKSQFQEALDLLEDDSSLDALVLKADIYVSLKDFENAVKSLDVALNIKDNSQVQLKKADALYRWAKVTYFPDSNFDKALDLIDRALEICPDGDESLEYWFLKGEILQSQEMHIDARRCFLKAENRLDELEALERELALFEEYGSDVLINITGVNFYRGIEAFEIGMLVDLKIDFENEHDSDAIACMLDGEVLGYVANSEYTLINDVKGASDIKGMINENSRAEVLFIFQGQFVIARVIV